MHPDEDDNAAIIAAQAGDREAFAVLVVRYQEAAFRAAFLIVRDAALAEDLAQEGFVRAYRSLGRFRKGEPFRPWLLRIVTNLALNELRGRGRWLAFLARAGRTPQDDVPGPERALVGGERQRQLWLAINELPLDDRVVLYLRYFLELPEREIASVIGKAPGTVKSRHSRAAARLRLVIETRYPDLRPGEAEKGERGDA